MASLIAGGVTKMEADNQNAQINPQVYQAPPAVGQQPVYYPPPPQPQQGGQYPPQASGPAYYAPPPVQGTYAPPPAQATTVNMNGVQYAPPGYNPQQEYTINGTLKRGLEEDPAARQKREATAKLNELEIQDRMKFIRKVYAILFFQLAITCGVCAAMMYGSVSFKIWLLTAYWFPWVMLVVCLLTMIALFAKRHEEPLNYILLVLFTIFEAMSVGSIVTFYDTRVVLQAFITTTAVFVGLSAFALQTKKDFSFLWPFLSGALMALIIAGFMQLFLPYNYWYDLVIAIVTALVFCGYVGLEGRKIVPIVYDTQMIFRRMSPDDWVPACVMLYLDILNLFLAFVRIFGKAK